MANALEQLKGFTIVVADTGEIDQIAKFKPQDATTNPSLIYAATQLEQYKEIVQEAVEYGKRHGSHLDERLSRTIDFLSVAFGKKILGIISGRVSTEIDARLSFDTEATVMKAREIIKMYEKEGISKERILIKIASTWEGIQAGKILEGEGIHVNMTLLFSMVQAQACAEAKVTLISPFAGRITDFYKEKEKRASNFVYPAHEDPGLHLKKNYIFHLYSKMNIFLFFFNLVRCQVSEGDLQLLQEAWIRDSGDGSFIQEQGADDGTCRLRPPHHLPKPPL